MNQYVGVHELQMVKANVRVTDGQIEVLSDPLLRKCPMRSRAFGHETETPETVKGILHKHMEKLGLFSEDRVLELEDRTIATGASETLADALREDLIDCGVVTCDGAGTVVSHRANVVQAIGAIVPWLVMTTPIPRTQERLKALGCLLLDDKATTNPAAGVRLALALGWRRIGVTIPGILSRLAKEIRDIERAGEGAEVTILAVHNTGITEEYARTLLANADAVWGCASRWAREIIAPQAILQVQGPVPVFVLTQRGKRAVLARVLHYESTLLIQNCSLPVLPAEIQPEPLL